MKNLKNFDKSTIAWGIALVHVVRSCDSEPNGSDRMVRQAIMDSSGSDLDANCVKLVDLDLAEIQDAFAIVDFLKEFDDDILCNMFRATFK